MTKVSLCSQARPGLDQVLDGHDQRWVRHDPEVVADRADPSGEDPHVVAGASLVDRAGQVTVFLPGQTSTTELGTNLVEKVTDLEMVVPGLEGSRGGGAAHPSAVLTETFEHHVASVGVGETP